MLDEGIFGSGLVAEPEGPGRGFWLGLVVALKPGELGVCPPKRNSGVFRKIPNDTNLEFPELFFFDDGGTILFKNNFCIGKKLI